tara:strand:+ start:4777 stop:4965 length:189 start_codon:yes stop_codon:yes gene_type:complete
MATFIDSLWFNATMSVLAVVILGQKIIRNIISGDYFKEIIIIIIWIVISFHFIKETIKKKNM